MGDGAVAFRAQFRAIRNDVPKNYKVVEILYAPGGKN
jgi:hypothetical protein